MCTAITAQPWIMSYVPCTCCMLSSSPQHLSFSVLRSLHVFIGFSQHAERSTQQCRIPAASCHMHAAMPAPPCSTRFRLQHLWQSSSIQAITGRLSLDCDNLPHVYTYVQTSRFRIAGWTSSQSHALIPPLTYLSAMPDMATHNTECLRSGRTRGPGALLKRLRAGRFGVRDHFCAQC